MMRCAVRGLVLAVSFIGVALTGAADAQDKKKDDLKSMTVDIDGLKADAPKDWVREKPANLLRSYQFRLPKADGDKEDADLGILPDVTGKDEDNIARWKKMFLPADGKSIDDSSKIEKLKVGAVKLTYLDVQGTYLKKQRPLDPDAKAMKMPNYRMFSVLFETKENTHLIRVIGPAKTLEQNKKAFDDWLKSFK